MPDESPSPPEQTPEPPPEPATGKFIDLKGAQVTDQRTVGPLGGVLVVTRPESIPAEDWSGCDQIILRALLPEEDENEEAVARLREDVEALVGIDHPGLLRVLGFAKHKNNEFVAIECPSGETLQSLIARRELPSDRALRLGRAIASALAELAKRGRPHRDFSSSAVFVTKDDSVRVVPVACPREFRVESRVSPKGLYNGEPLYAAPELHEAGGSDPTERSNIFSFGVVLYEMLAYQPPFRGGTPTRLLADVAETTPRLPSTIISSLPQELDSICLRCIDKDPERRYPGFAAVESTLRIAAQSLTLGNESTSRRAPSTRALAVAAPPLPSDPSSTKTTVRTPAARGTSGRQKGILIALAAVVVAALGLVALVFPRGKRSALESETIAKDVFEQAGRLIEKEKYEKAWRLLDSHRDSIREISPSKFDKLLRSARSSDWARKGRAAQEEGRWKDAARAFEKALADSDDSKDFALHARLEESLFRAELDRAEAAERVDDWRTVAQVLEKAISLGEKRGMPESELEPLRANVVFAEVMVEVGEAKETGDADAERECLFRAVELRRGDSSIMNMLSGLGAGPKAARDMLARARKAFDAGESFEAKRLAEEASLLWPADKRPQQVLRYLADRSYCEQGDTIFISATGPWESWGPNERAKAFCIDPYEFLDEGGRLPRTRISGLEAAATCRKRGGRLCRAAEWQLACSGPNRRVFPYGNRYIFDACNTTGKGPAGPGTARDCRGPFGTYDMSGNVAEWTADYIRGKGQIVAGGDWSSGEAGSTCKSLIHFKPGLSSPRVGFRCCRSMPAADDPGP